MPRKIAHLALYDALADWEPGYLLAELRTGRYISEPFDVVTVGQTPEPITTMGGVRIVPDAVLDDIDPANGHLLIMSGAVDAEGPAAFAPAARRCVEAGVPVAAICEGTAALARAGLLDDRDHTSAARQYLAATGYAGTAHYRDERAVADRGVITAGPQSPVQFACAALACLGVASAEVLEAYAGVMYDAEPSAFGRLMTLTGQM